MNRESSFSPYLMDSRFRGNDKKCPKCEVFAKLFCFVLAAGLLVATVPAQAQVPGLEFLQLPANAEIGEVLARLYIWGIGFVALAAFLMLTWGGVLYMIAGDKDPSEAKSKMRNAIYGLLLALGSYLILYTINPALVNIANLELPPINQVAPPQTETPPNPETFGYCARRGIVLCPLMSSTACDGIYYPRQNPNAFDQCAECTRKLNDGRPLSACTTPAQ